jgi:hypothetical protein
MILCEERNLTLESLTKLQHKIFLESKLRLPPENTQIDNYRM